MKKCNIVLSEKNDVMDVIRLLVPSSLLECDGCDDNYYHNYDESEVLIIMDFSAVYTNMNEGIHVVFEWHNFTEQMKYFSDLITEQNEYIDELNNKIARLELANEELTNKIGELTLQKSGYEYSNQILLSELGEYEQTVQIYHDRMEASENGKKQFTERAKKIIAEKNEKINYLNDFICSLQKHLYSDRQTIKEYEEKIKILQNENDVLWNVIFD